MSNLEDDDPFGPLEFVVDVLAYFAESTGRHLIRAKSDLKIKNGKRYLALQRSVKGYRAFNVMHAIVVFYDRDPSVESYIKFLKILGYSEERAQPLFPHLDQSILAHMFKKSRYSKESIRKTVIDLTEIGLLKRREVKVWGKRTIVEISAKGKRLMLNTSKFAESLQQK